jgi:GTP-binding protein Era
MSHKSGFVNIIGNPNVGKSTLMNVLVGEKLSIITSKAQTTRHRIMGIVNGDDFQIVYSDTPGIIKPHYKLQESMMRFIENALQDADIFLYVTDVNDQTIDQNITQTLNDSNVPVVLVINKIDLSQQDIVEEKIRYWNQVFPDAFVIPASALHRFNINTIFDKLLELLPEGEPFFPKDELTVRSVRFFVSEIIREKILLNYKQEIPYSVEIAIGEYKEKANIVYITSTVFVARESQKAIILGHQGKAIKKIGTQARKDIESFIGSKVFLEIKVKVKKDWRNDPMELKRFGYEL